MTLVKLWLMRTEMKKFFIGFLLVFCIICSAQSKYIRKQMQPNFFIPEESKFHKPEKLPPLVGQHIVKNKKINTDVIEYKNKVNEYHRDIAVLEKTGELPENKMLEADLQKMDSEDVVEVIDVKETPQNSVFTEFQNILQKSLNGN